MASLCDAHGDQPPGRQRTDRAYRNIGPTVPSVDVPAVTPFVVYDEAMSAMLGPNPNIKLETTDARAPFFYSGGAWLPATWTLFLTWSLIRDVDPSAVAAGGKRTEVSKIEVYSSDEFSRDKVRFPNHSYLVSGCAPYPVSDKQGVVLCVQGTLKEPAGLVFVDAKRPHKSNMILNNYQGRPFNSPCDIAINYLDNCLYFTDPGYGYERGYRPKPELPTGHIYRFDPSTGDCRVVVDRLARPGAIAFSPDFSILYVSDLGDKHGGTTVHAMDVMYSSHVAQPAGPSIVTNGGTLAGGAERQSNHHKNLSTSSTSSSVDSNSSAYLRDPPTASSRALAMAAGQERNVATPTPHNQPGGGGGGALARSNSRDRTRRFLDTGSRPLKSVSNGFSMNFKSSFNATPSLGAPAATSQRAPSSNSSHPNPYPGRPVSPEPALSSGGKSSSNSSSSTTATSSRRDAFVNNKRLFAYSTAFALSGGISTDPVHGHLWLGTEDGAEVFSATTGSLIGKVLAPPDDDHFGRSTTPSPTTATAGSSSDGRKFERKMMQGVSKVAFTDPGEAWLLGGERMWRITYCT